MEDSEFRFKKFSVNHSRSSMKVGVDAVLLGAWAGKDARKILDVGTGCGVISLILAQRFPEAIIKGVDIDQPSIEEARKNFEKSPWSERLSADLAEFPNDILKNGEKFDLIVSNPPFFRSGIVQPKSQREKARHQDTLSVFSLIENSSFLLEEEGILAFIFPVEFREEVLRIGNTKGFKKIRECTVRDREERKEKRVMIEMMFTDKEITELTYQLILFQNGLPTNDYQLLCKDFYLKF